ncbi:MAG: leucine-rich repeat protein [Clostridia bacterium]|nr:leucine-rich repeat protein [Clostridia bacterium]
MKRNFFKKIIAILLAIAVVSGFTVSPVEVLAARGYPHEHTAVDGICTDCGMPEEVVCYIYGNEAHLCDWDKANFSNEELVDFIIPETVEGVPLVEIDDNIFWKVERIRSVVISENMKTIGIGAFLQCPNLESVTIPSSVETINPTAFSGCPKLKSITVHKDNKNYCSDENGVLYNKDKTILMQYPCGKEDTCYVIPSGVETVDYGSFIMANNLRYIVLSDNVKHLGHRLVTKSENLKGVYIPRSVESFGLDVFYWVDSLSHIMYEGTEEEFNSIENIEGQIPENTTIHFGVTADDLFLKDAVEETCVEKGYTGDWYCNICESVVSQGSETEKAGHVYDVFYSTEKVTFDCKNCDNLCEKNVLDSTCLGGKFASSSADDVVFSFENKDRTKDSYILTVNGNTEVYSVSGIDIGEYTLKISKPYHVSREYDVIIGEESVSLDVRINLIGDINSDGRVNTIDVSQANAHARGSIALAGYDFDCADINADGKVNTLDVARMNAVAKGVSKPW